MLYNELICKNKLCTQRGNLTISWQRGYPNNTSTTHPSNQAEKLANLNHLSSFQPNRKLWLPQPGGEGYPRPTHHTPQTEHTLNSAPAVFQIRIAELMTFVFIPNYTQMVNKSAGCFSSLCGYSMLLLLDIDSHCLLRRCLKVTRCVCTFAPNSFFLSEVELPGSMLIRILNFTADSMSFYCCHTFASCFWATSLYLPGR